MSGLCTYQKLAIISTDKGGIDIDTFDSMSDLARQAFRIVFVRGTVVESRALLALMTADLEQEIVDWLPEVKK